MASDAPRKPRTPAEVTLHTALDGALGQWQSTVRSIALKHHPPEVVEAMTDDLIRATNFAAELRRRAEGRA